MNPALPAKPGLHPRNRHRTGYDFPALVRAAPGLAPWVGPNRFGGVSIDFAHPSAVRALNAALLQHDYDIAQWEIPAGYLCPPVPGRADYIHLAADLLAADRRGKIPRGDAVAILDIGTGANCIYPIIGRHDYGWRFVGTEIDPIALASAQAIVRANPQLAGGVELRRQSVRTAIFRGAIKPRETFALSLCNPPFHASAAEAATGTQRKQRNLAGSRKRGATAPAPGTAVTPARASATAPAAVLNFGGVAGELWCPGGELAFVRRMIAESAEIPAACRWFTTLLAKSEHLPAVERALAAAGVADVRVIAMAQGQKRSRIVAWSFRRSA